MAFGRNGAGMEPSCRGYPMKMENSMVVERDLTRMEILSKAPNTKTTSLTVFTVLIILKTNCTGYATLKMEC
jgi:hypothetical protein